MGLIHFTTFTGRNINPFELKEEDIDIADIAHALALCNRFAGHTRYPISVAQHSVWVSYLVARQVGSVNRSLVRQALLHDASEAYLGDVNKWLKGTPEFAHYRAIEARVQSLIYRRFECSDVVCQEVEVADRIMVRFEGMRGYSPDWRIPHPDYPALTDEELKHFHSWAFWDWPQAQAAFLSQFQRTMPL